MKKWLVVLMTVLALCLMCSGAMAATWDLSTYTADPIEIAPESGDIITGSTNFNVELDCGGKELTFKNVVVNASVTLGSSTNTAPMKLNLVGNNRIGEQNYFNGGLYSHGSLTIDGTGSLTIETSSLSFYVSNLDYDASLALVNGTVNVFGDENAIVVDKDIVYLGGTLTAYSGDSYQEPALLLESGVLKFLTEDYEIFAGSNAANAVSVTAYNGEQYVKISPKANAGGGDPAPQPSAPTAPTAPKTGDESNLALWACLMTLSAIGLVVVGKKFKKAF